MFTAFEASIITWSVAAIAVIAVLSFFSGTPWRRP